MNTVLCGWSAERAVGETLLRCAEFVADWAWCLVTSVDSEPDVTSMPWAEEVRNRFSNSVDHVGGALLLPGRVLVEVVARGDVLFGFDEIWFCTSAPRARPAISDFLVAPRRLDETGACDGFSWIQGSPFVGGIGDGDGMNWVLADLALAEGLELADERDEIP